MFRPHVRQLKALRRFPVPPEALVSGRMRLVAAVEAAPMLRRSSIWFTSAAWRPVMTAMVVIVFVGGGGTVVAAHDALPGDRLYAVKLAAEGVSERVAVTPEQRFVVQAAHASRRLEETESLLARQGIVGEDRVARVRDAMGRYEDHLFTMNEIAVIMGSDPEKPEKGTKALMAAEGMLDRHARLIESATRAEPFVASLMIEPIGDSLSLEADMFSSIPTDDGERVEGLKLRRRERDERIGASLKRMREGIRDRGDEDSREGRDGEGRE